MKNKIVIFDFDGVIVNSIELSFQLNKESIIDLEFTEWQSWFEGNIYKNIRQEFSGETYQIKYFEKYSERLINLLPVDGMEKVLEKLSFMKYKMIIVSSGSEKAIKDFLEKNGLKKYFIEIMARETHKGKVEKFKIIFEKYKIKASQTLMVTDTIGDIKEAKEVKIKTIGVGWGVHEVKRLKENGADFVASEPSDILKGIEKMLKFTT